MIPSAKRDDITGVRRGKRAVRILFLSLSATLILTGLAWLTILAAGVLIGHQRSLTQ
jgi:hypothetical protein